SGASAGCTPQQSPHCSVAAELQSPMANPSQQDRCPEDARQASAGMNAHSITIAGNRSTPFLLTRIL
ncbi:MAG TPA: hypothetical protein VGG42_06260, partial [Acidobacteriaceae bacterium]